MAWRRKLSEGKKNIIAGLIEEYNIQTANDIQEALKDLLGGTIQEMLEAELYKHLFFACSPEFFTLKLFRYITYFYILSNTNICYVTSNKFF